MPEDKEQELSQEERQQREADARAQRILQASQEAQALLGNKLLEKFFEDFDSECKRRIWAADVADMEAMKSIKEQHSAMLLLKRTLEEYAIGGKMVAFNKAQAAAVL